MPLPPWVWIAFGASLSVLLVIDLAAHRGGREHSQRAAIVWSGIWIGAGVAFGGFVWWLAGGNAAQEYIAAYAIEKSLSLDNLFVWLLIFQTLAIPREHQRDVLLWGVLGALVFRAVFVLAGVRAIERWDWVTYVFGAILFWAAYRALRDDPRSHRESGIVHALSRVLPVSRNLSGRQFIVRKNGQRCATPLLIALIAVELTDIVFAIDSVPAALSITRNTFLVYSSNAFAILGLRSLYYVAAGTLAEMRFLHYGIAAVLAFAALKIMLADWLHIPPLASIAIVVSCIALPTWLSLRHRESWARQT